MTKIVPPGLWAGSRWELEDTRRRTLEVLVDLDPSIIDSSPEGFENSIGSLLHHIALIEADWLYADMLEQEYPKWMYERFPDEDRDQIGHLVAPEMPLDRHLDTLAYVRSELLKELDALEAEPNSSGCAPPTAASSTRCGSCITCASTKPSIEAKSRACAPGSRAEPEQGSI